MNDDVKAAADRCRDALSCTWLDLDNLSAGFAGDLLTLARAYLAEHAPAPPPAPAPRGVLPEGEPDTPVVGGRYVRRLRPLSVYGWAVYEYYKDPGGIIFPQVVASELTEADAFTLAHGPAALRAAADAMAEAIVPLATLVIDEQANGPIREISPELRESIRKGHDAAFAALARLRAGGGGS